MMDKILSTLTFKTVQILQKLISLLNAQKQKKRTKKRMNMVMEKKNKSKSKRKMKRIKMIKAMIRRS